METPSSLIPTSSSVVTLRTLIPTDEIQASDLVFLFLGKMGSGRSNIINKLTGMQPEDGADNYASVSCTRDVCAYAHYHNGQRFIFVDTPGFNQKRPQAEVLREIAEWLKETYQRSVELTGVIYTHDIEDNGSSATDLQTFQLLDRLCGHAAADRVRLVTTMCDGVDQQVADNKEAALKIKWQPLLKAGAHHKRFLNTSESGWEIVESLGETKKPLLLQKELKDGKKGLDGTTAGKCLWQTRQATFRQVTNICIRLLSSPNHSLTVTGSDGCLVDTLSNVFAYALHLDWTPSCRKSATTCGLRLMPCWVCGRERRTQCI
ncbi:P-loop containing nucleoside triphosphate hydrolase protein [Pisolithus marmoratus]|nr:P-loop containing nucleoside triphosphate hydrolase protein [Pisolithus marmoratus]